MRTWSTTHWTAFENMRSALSDGERFGIGGREGMGSDDGECGGDDGGHEIAESADEGRVVALHSEHQAKGALIEIPLGSRPWRDVEYSIREPNGCYVTFTENEASAGQRL
jgi:hypothetical protein